MSDLNGGPPGPMPLAGPSQEFLSAPLPQTPKPKLFLPTKLKDSMRFFQVPARRWWWGLIALAVYVVCYLIVQVVGSIIMLANDPSVLEAAREGEELPTTPSLFLINNIAIALDIGVCTLLAWLFFRQGFGWLVSVVGRFRWKWMVIALGIFAAGYAVEMIVEILLYGAAEYGIADLEIKPYTWFMAVSVLVTTPLQCAGEEFQSRAFLPKLITAIVPFRVPGLVLSALVPSAVFMYLHDAQDPWLNLNYFCAALMMWWLAYRTGGIEASIALHFVNNIFSEWMLPFTDFSDMFDRSEGTGSPVVLIYLGVQLILVLIVDWVARRKGVVRMSAPAAVVPAVVKPRRFVTMIEGSVVQATKDDLPRIETTPREMLFPVMYAPAMEYPPIEGYPPTVVQPTIPVVQPTIPVVQPTIPVVQPTIPVILPQAGSPPAYPATPAYSPATGYPPTVILPQAGSPPSSDIPSQPVAPTPYAAPEEPTTPRHAWIDVPSPDAPPSPPHNEQDSPHD